MQNFIIAFLFLIFSTSFSFAAQDNSQIVISLKTAGLQVDQAEALYNSGQFKETESIIAKLRPLLSESTELHSQLYESIKDDSGALATAEIEKRQTIEFAKLRDKANYLAGLASMKQGNNLEAVKHFVLVVQSQRTTGLGEKAYNALRDLGFSPKLSIKDQI